MLCQNAKLFQGTSLQVTTQTVMMKKRQTFIEEEDHGRIPRKDQAGMIPT